MSKVGNAEWSEEDEEMRTSIISILDRLGFKEFCESSRDQDAEEDRLYHEEIAWLKSLSPSWKPSAEQLAALKWQLEHPELVKWRKGDLESLYEQLKRL